MITNKELKENIKQFDLGETAEKYLLDLNKKINEALAKPLIKKNQNKDLHKKLKKELGKKYETYSITGKMGMSLLFKLWGKECK